MMDVVERDFPSQDLEKFFGSSHIDYKKDHIYDTMIQGLRMIESERGTKNMIVLVGFNTQKSGAAKVENLREIYESNVNLHVILLDQVQQKLQDIVRDVGTLYYCERTKDLPKILSQVQESIEN